MFIRARFLATELAAFLTACSSPSTEPSGETIDVGVDVPVSATDVSNGIATQTGAVMTIEAANIKGNHDPAAGAQTVATFLGARRRTARAQPKPDGLVRS